MAELKISGLHKYYGSTHVLRGIDLEIPEGEFTVFVGPSGCGKSTLLRTIAGLEEASKGNLEIDGEVVNDIRPRDRDIAMVFQNYALYPYMDVFENIAFGLRARKFPNDQIQKRVHEAAELLNIGPYLKRLPKELSGGQRQRVAIGRAIVRDARLFLFDEPLSNLDAQLREDMRSEIKRLHQEIGKTMIYVTHDQVEAMTLADRIVLLNGGLIEQIGSPIDLFEHPINRFVASFLGSPSIRFTHAQLKDEQGGLCLTFDSENSVMLPEGRAKKLQDYIDSEILVGIRPEHLRRTSTATSGGTLSVKIDLLQPTGSRSYGTFQLGDSPIVAELEVHDVRRAGDRIDLEVDMNRTILIDPKTELVI